MSSIKILLRILTDIKYGTLAFLVAFIVFTLAVWVSNTELIITIVLSGEIPFENKLGLLVSLYGLIITNFTVFSATYTTLIAILFGVDIALIFYYVKKMKKSSSGVGVTGSAGIGGVISGALGIGCVSCGTFVLTSLLGVFGIAWVLSFLPLGGAEFGLIGVVLLTYGIYHLLKKIQNPNVCV